MGGGGNLSRTGLTLASFMAIAVICSVINGQTGGQTIVNSSDDADFDPQMNNDGTSNNYQQEDAGNFRIGSNTLGIFGDHTKRRNLQSLEDGDDDSDEEGIKEPVQKVFI